jgi:hypothetical protein
MLRSMFSRSLKTSRTAFEVSFAEEHAQIFENVQNRVNTIGVLVWEQDESFMTYLNEDCLEMVVRIAWRLEMMVVRRPLNRVVGNVTAAFKRLVHGLMAGRGSVRLSKGNGKGLG